jgi:DDE superfamily endonuclease
LRDYRLGLPPRERKSVEPMAAVTAPARVAAQHQSLLHFVGNARWSDERVLARVRELVLPTLKRRGPIEALIIDDTGFPKKGRHSVGVARQYCGQLDKQGQLPGGGHPVDCQPLGQLADRLPAVSAAGMDGRCRAPGPGRGTGSVLPASPKSRSTRSAPRGPPVFRRASC